MCAACWLPVVVVMQCCNLCKQQDLCTAWVFCNSPSGCGQKGSCTSYINSLASNKSVTGAVTDVIPGAVLGLDLSGRL